MKYSPLEQFEIRSIKNLGLGWIDITIQNSMITMMIIVMIIGIIGLATSPEGEIKIIPTRWQNVIEMIYEVVGTMAKEQIGEKGRYYVPFLMSLFMLIILSNLIGLVPYSYTITTQIAITFVMSLGILIGVTIIGFEQHGIEFLGVILPSGASIILAPLLVMIELISYLARGVSLAVRLSANMMAGHTLLKIISTFGWKMIIGGGILTILGIGPTIAIMGLMCLELGICMLQAYVFTVLTASYINDAINLH